MNTIRVIACTKNDRSSKGRRASVSALGLALLATSACTTAFLTGCAGGDSSSSESVEQRSDAIEDANDKTAFDFFVDKGLTPVQAAGIVGNLDQESGMVPTI